MHNYPLPNMELLIQQVASSQIMTLLDGFLGYNQVSIKKYGKHKKTFTTKWGTYAFNCMPFGLPNILDTF